ncbi:MAG: energy transducer TonB [Prevotella sp.]|nr:energy transducer TonB [Prevotella sp.]
MKKIISILALLLCMVSVQGQSKQGKGQQDTAGDYEFILPEKAELNMEYPKNVRVDDAVQTYKALSYDELYETAFIYNEKHCGYYYVPSELRSGFRSSVRNLQKENSALYWKRVKEIMAAIDRYWGSHQPVSSVGTRSYGSSLNDGGHSSEEKVFDIVEQMPSFPGGMGALMQFLASHIKYPMMAEMNGIQGRVICTCIIEKDGTITNVRVSRSVDPLLDAEAIRVISSMPKWVPGKQNGIECRVKFTLPVTFKLQ